MRNLTILLGFLLSMSLSAEVYRSVDEDGNVVFTDQPSPDAELIEVDEVQTVKPPPAGEFKYTPPAKKPRPRYSEISITSPQHDVAIRDNAGNITVNVAVSPRVHGSDKLIVYLDGKEHDLGNATSKTFTAVDRGTHQLRAAIKNDAGRILLSSKSVTFHLLRQSVIPAARAN